MNSQAFRSVANGVPPPELLPRLLYLGDVPVEASYHGSALLYRLLQTYPADKLMIVEAGTESSKPERRVGHVLYSVQRLSLSRLQMSRFSRWYAAACLHTATLRVGRFTAMARRWRPDAILTVTHGISWITAAELARRLDVPLHLICHDEWARLPGGARQVWKEQIFGRVYRQAASRLCVSPFMAQEFEARYGAPGFVLYPSRACDAKRYPGPPDRLLGTGKSFTCAYAGSINSPGFVDAINLLVQALKQVGSRLLIYGPATRPQVQMMGIDMEHVDIMGLVPSHQLIEELRSKADAVFVPMSFDEHDRANMELSFPSKLTDYTAAALPLLIFGPDYCSAVRWAMANEGAAEVVTSQDIEPLLASIRRLGRDPSHRLALASTAYEAGERYFSYAAAERLFRSVLVRKGHPAEATLESADAA